MRDVQFIDSSGLGVFVREYSRLNEIGESFAFIKVNEKVQKIFRWANFSHVKSYDSIEDALANLS